MMNVVLAFISSVVLMFGQGLKPGQVSVHADSQIIEASVFNLKGNVEIVTEYATVRADEAVFNVHSGDIEAQGNLRFAKSGLPAKALPKEVQTLKINVRKAGVMFKVRAPRNADQSK